MSSTRFPGKVLHKINGIPMIKIIIERIRAAKNVSQIIVATSYDSSDDVLVDTLEEMKIDFYRGSLHDVFSRYVSIIESKNFESFIRLTGDNPLIDFKLLDIMIEEYKKNHKFDYYSNTLERSYPKGLDIEIVKSQALLDISKLELTKSELEHVTLAIYSRDLNLNIGQKAKTGINLQNLRWTVDSREDLERIKIIFQEFSPQIIFDFEMILEKLSNFHK